ncbi:ruBisCO large subunit-binding protein subunit beta, chloroplastic-like isoform X2 [Durio zibethinus]|uniref:RuBisCO large subunit-binding protein subunit beta, chloroplastic-like isoform X2 n=1 Tax=Durio zibethinus TaxID=66656 RepID=A0A6P6ALE8_DURZI|nr:ruBisCO large subunit-binding protein subunit beta, chloroplastic-like isoform X2 [Durio zibethinus]
MLEQKSREPKVYLKMSLCGFDENDITYFSPQQRKDFFTRMTPIIEVVREEGTSRRNGVFISSKLVLTVTFEDLVTKESYNDLLIIVKTNIGEELTAKVASVCPTSHLMLLRVKKKQGQVSYVEFAEDQPGYGSEVQAIYCNDISGYSYRRGILSFIGRKFSYVWDILQNGTENQKQFAEKLPIGKLDSCCELIQTHGLYTRQYHTAGAPLFNNKGRLIGLNAFFVFGFDFGICLSELRRFFDTYSLEKKRDKERKRRKRKRSQDESETKKKKNYKESETRKKRQKHGASGASHTPTTGVNKVADLVEVTLGPKSRNVVLESKYDFLKIVNDGVTVAKEVELEDPVENIGAKLVRQAAAKTNNLAGGGMIKSVVLAEGLIAEGVKVVAAGANPVLITRGIEKTTKASVSVLKDMSKGVEDSELADVAAVSAGNNYEVGNMIAEAMSKSGLKGVVTLEEGKSAEYSLYVVDRMQFDRGYVSPYFVTDSEKMALEYENCKLLLVDEKITNARDLINILEDAIRSGYPILIIAEEIEQEALATLVVNKLRGALKVAALKGPGFREYLDDIAILTEGAVIRDEAGLSLDKAGKEVLGHASKVMLTKDTTTIAGDGSTQQVVNQRVVQIRILIEAAVQEYEKEKLNERIAKLSGGIVVIQAGAQTETEVKEQKLRVEDAFGATKAAVEEGIVAGGGCTLLRLASKVVAIKDSVGNDEEKNGFNAATGKYEDLMAAGIIHPTKVCSFIELYIYFVVFYSILN